MRTDRVAILAIALLAAGCQNPSATLVHAGTDPIPDIAGHGDAALPRDGGPVTLDGTPVAAGAQPAPSTTTLDRSSWGSVTVNQPRGQVEVQPTYYSLFEGFSKDPRATGQYPTTATALKDHGESNTALADGGAAPVIGIYWLATAPGRILFLPPWTVRHQPEGDSIEWLPAAQVRGTAAPATRAAPATPAAPATTTKE